MSIIQQLEQMATTPGSAYTIDDHMELMAYIQGHVREVEQSWHRLWELRERELRASLGVPPLNARVRRAAA